MLAMKLNKFDSEIKIMFLYIAMFLCFDYSLAQDAPFTVSASYKADYVQNMSGGLEVGGGYGLFLYLAVNFPDYHNLHLIYLVATVHIILFIKVDDVHCRILGATVLENLQAHLDVVEHGGVVGIDVLVGAGWSETVVIERPLATAA